MIVVLFDNLSNKFSVQDTMYNSVMSINRFGYQLRCIKSSCTFLLLQIIHLPFFGRGGGGEFKNKNTLTLSRDCKVDLIHNTIYI